MNSDSLNWDMLPKIIHCKSTHNYVHYDVLPELKTFGFKTSFLLDQKQSKKKERLKRAF
jgi:hypothetical protein